MRQAVEERRGYLNATDLADYLARRGVAFREAHGIAGGLVKLAAERGVGLADLTLGEMRAASPAIGEDVYKALTVEACLAARDVPGGTAPERVRGAIREAKTWLEKERDPSL
jgi:argininosuccinate lyase